ncbi:MAG: Gfo/Idh/MocA family oxidoreductase [Kiritimatiellae bacterium]|jgi:myo-inositol 2-dehydrogenase/D-chiro-inositol 1-dehydrogenase|nr:Gfo/Idh/MocA family oxidoreductase [Kiritimatiellia bacterium]
MKFSRRSFVAGAGMFAAAAPSISLGQSKRIFKVALVGCGGRGSGAIRDITKAAERMGHQVVLVGAADFFVDKAKHVCKSNGCDEKFAFGGPSGYKKVMESDAEIVLLATPPIFRALHAAACVKAGKHIFAEKPVATDPAGLRAFLKVVEDAKAAKLSILAGTVHRHNNRALRQIKPIQDGIIGEIRGGVVYRCHGGMNTSNYLRPRRADDTNAAYLANDWYMFHEMSGDHFTEQAIHEVDLANWFIGRYPKTAMGIGARHRRVTGNTYDCFSIDYNYGDDLHIHSIARQINGCSDRCCTSLVGEYGTIDVLGKIKRFDGKEIVYDEERIKGRDGNGLIMEHWDFLTGLISGDYVQEGEQVAMATATTLMGVLAAYTGQTVRMSDLLTNEKSVFYNMNNAFTAQDFESGKDVPLPKEGCAPVPGKA